MWFTYDASGGATWFVLPPGSWVDDKTYAGPINRVTSSLLGYVGIRYDFSGEASPGGDVPLHFTTTQRATMEYTVDGHSATLALERQPF